MQELKFLTVTCLLMQSCFTELHAWSKVQGSHSRHVKLRNAIPSLDHEPDCNADWTCYNYNGKLGYNETCISDGEKRDLFVQQIDPLGTSSNTDIVNNTLLTELDLKSCNVMQYMECREVSLNEIDHEPLYGCSCPDHEKGDSPDAVKKSKSYFDNKTQRCVLKVRAKCSALVIPDDAKRLNGTRRYLTRNMKKVVDGRRQWLTLPCVKNAHCNIYKGNNPVTTGSGSRIRSLNGPVSRSLQSEGVDEHDQVHSVNREDEDDDEDDIDNVDIFAAVDHLKNRCICNDGYIAGEDDQCHRILDSELDFYSCFGILLIVIAFSVSLWVLNEDQQNMYYPIGYTNYT